MGTDPNGYGVAQISRSGSSGTYTCAVMNSTGNRPITYVSWFGSARFFDLDEQRATAVSECAVVAADVIRHIPADHCRSIQERAIL